MPEVRNLLHDPKPVATGGWKQGGGKNLTIRMLGGDKLHITNNANIVDSYAYLWLTSVPAGVWRFGAEVSTPQNGYATNILRMFRQRPTSELAPAVWDGTAGRYVTPPNELNADGPVELRVMVGPNANSAIWVRKLFLVTDEDYQHMTDDGIIWFDGDGIVRGGASAS